MYNQQNKRNKGKVSVISPVYNGENYISSFLLAISSQQYKNFEWIIVDDGSQDNTHIIIENYVTQHPDDNIVLVRQKNEGVSSARNSGLKIATGAFIMFADTDDNPHSEFVNEYVKILEESNSNIAIFGLNLMNPNGSREGVLSYSDEEVSNETALKRLFNQNSYGYLFSVIARKSVWTNKTLNSDLYFLEDEEVLVRLFLDSDSVLFSSKILYDYVQRETSVVHNLSLNDYKNAYISTLAMKNDVIKSNLHNLESTVNARVLGALVPLIVLSLREKQYDQADYYINIYLSVYKETAIVGMRGLRRKILTVLFKLKLTNLILFIYRNVVF